MNKYEEWINNKLKTGNPYGNCEKWSKQMKKQFPELKLVRGFFHCLFWGKREHWWLVCKNNKIIDPTVTQFNFKGIGGDYEELDESQEHPTGKCYNCGEYCYKGASFCCPACKNEMKKEIPNLI